MSILDAKLDLGFTTTSNIDPDTLNTGVSSFTFASSSAVSGGTSLIRSTNNTPIIAYEGVSAVPAPVVYTDEAAYIEALAAGGYESLRENFEDDVVWVESRSSIARPGSTPYVISQEIKWTSNQAVNNVSTNDSGISGSFGFYSNPHGDQTAETNPTVCDVKDPIPQQCFLHDGFVGTSDGAGKLYGVGGWIKGMPGADVTLFLDGVEVDFGKAGRLSSWTFLGVIDAAGFSSFEFREINGKGEQVIYIFADDITLGVSAVPVPNSDADGDGIADQLDNCIDVQNPAQQDTDSDGYGNICDADLDNSGGVVNFGDLALFKAAFGTADPDADFNGDGTVNLSDFSIFRSSFGKAPGPSCVDLPSGCVP